MLPAFCERAVRIIRERALERKPFFLYMPLNAPHTPILPGAEFRGRSGAGDYGDFVVQCDDVVGRIMAALEETAQADRTLLVFTSDNGAERIAYQRARETGHYSMGSLRGLKRDIWEGGHRIPFLARWAGRIPPGTVSDGTICLTDLLATAAELVGARLPDGGGEDSVSLLAALAGGEQVGGEPFGREPFGREPGKPREAVVHHSAHGNFAVRRGPWVLIDAPTGDDNGAGGEPDWLKKERGYRDHGFPGELYNLEDDAGEARNLYGERPQVVAELKLLLERIKADGRNAVS